MLVFTVALMLGVNGAIGINIEGNENFLFAILQCKTSSFFCDQ